MMNLPSELEEDSEDLTDAEVETAVAVPSVDAMLERLRQLRCQECDGEVEVNAHALRRRTPFFYARMGFRCTNGHDGNIVFRADWLSS